MSRSSSKSNWAPLLVIGALVALVSVYSLSGRDKIEGDDNDAEESEDEGDVAAETAVAAESPQDLEEEAKRAADAEAKALFDNALSMADKLTKGQRYAQAAAKYSEAIAILQAGTTVFDKKTIAAHTLPLHNNRSAMYEKAGAEHYQQALEDIALVLNLDNKHKKARARRARILEATQQFPEALIDYTIHFMLEQLDPSPTQAPTSGAKVDELGKIIAVQNAANGRGQGQELGGGEIFPSKSFCRKCFELFPSTNVWCDKFKTGTVEDLIRQFNAAPSANNLEELLSVVTCAISRGAFNTAFSYLLKPAQVDPSAQQGAQQLLALQKRLLGMRKQLLRDMPGAVALYKESLALQPEDLESMLMLACSYIEMGSIDDAQQSFRDIFSQRAGTADSLLHSFVRETNEGVADLSSLVIDEIAKYCVDKLSASERVELAYCLFHRSSLWVARDSNYQFRKDAIALANGDLRLSWLILEGVGDSVDAPQKARRVYVTTLLKLINLRSSTKGNAGFPQTAEDVAMCKQCMELANRVEPENPSVIMLNSDVLSMEEKYDECMPFVEKLIETADNDDGIPFVMRANLLVHQGARDLLVAQENEDTQLYQKAQDDLTEAGKIYERALEIDSNCVEALAQASQLKGLVWDFEGSASLAAKAVTLARTPDERIDLEILQINAQARFAAVQELSRNQQENQ